MSSQVDAPTPTLRIIPVEKIHPHEVHDPQRSAPLMARISQSEVMTNPIIVAPMGDSDQFVVLDGANRYHTFCSLGYSRILAQVIDYDSPHVTLKVWHHILSHWADHLLIEAIEKMLDVTIHRGWDEKSVARLILKDGIFISIDAESKTLADRNALLCNLVEIYQKHATLNRTAIDDPANVWSLYKNAIALVQFPHYRPHEIVASAKNNTLLPPGISRHIIQGRALKVNYPMSTIKDNFLSLAEANAQLANWLRTKLEKRAIRYYAESTYQFDE